MQYLTDIFLLEQIHGKKIEKNLHQKQGYEWYYLVGAIKCWKDGKEASSNRMIDIEDNSFLSYIHSLFIHSSFPFSFMKVFIR